MRNADYWRLRWADLPKAPTAVDGGNGKKEKRGFAAVMAWPAALLILQGAIYAPLFGSGFLNSPFAEEGVTGFLLNPTGQDPAAGVQGKEPASSSETTKGGTKRTSSQENPSSGTPSSSGVTGGGNPSPLSSSPGGEGASNAPGTSPVPTDSDPVEGPGGSSNPGGGEGSLPGGVPPVPPPSDQDGDGIPDARDPDLDGDGVNNADEVEAGTDPKKADSDGDGVPDGREDADGDGVPNASESDPTSSKVTDRDGDGQADISTPLPIVALRLEGGQESTVRLEALKVYPGDVQPFVVKASNGGNVPLGSLSMTVRSSNPLFEDRREGLQVHVWSCSSPWSGSVKKPKCSGTITKAAPFAAGAGKQDLRLGAMRPHEEQHLLIGLQLSPQASDKYQGKKTSVSISVSAQQTGGVIK